MPIEAANQYLPQSNRMVDAFDLVIKQHFTIGKTLEDIRKASMEKIAQAAADFFTAGVAYLANRGHDSYIQEVGTTTWWAVNQQRVLPALTDDMIAAAIHLGVPPQLASTYSSNDGPYVLFLGNRHGIELIEAAYVLLPPQFVVKAQVKPVEALATMAWIGSQVRDMVNGRVLLDQQNINRRARATESHFLLRVIEENPDIELADMHKRTLKLFPKGINSLPTGVWYKGNIGAETTAPENN